MIIFLSHSTIFNFISRNNALSTFRPNRDHGEASSTGRPKAGIVTRVTKARHLLFLHYQHINLSSYINVCLIYVVEKLQAPQVRPATFQVYGW
jgi:hypothetical protein